MGISVHMNYSFTLDGVEHVGFGQEFGETEKESDIEELNKDTYNNRISAYCNAFNLTVNDLEENENNYYNEYLREFKRCKFNYVELY